MISKYACHGLSLLLLAHVYIEYIGMLKLQNFFSLKQTTLVIQWFSIFF